MAPPLRILFRVVLGVALLGVGSVGFPREPVVAVLCALPAEAEPLERLLVDRGERTLQGMRFVTGRLKGRPVVLLVTGVGKVNAAVGTTLALVYFRPHRVFFSGVAGGIHPDLGPGDVVIGGRALQYDFGVFTDQGFRINPTPHPLTNEPNPLFLDAEECEVAVAQEAASRVVLESVRGRNGLRAPRVLTGTVATGDLFICSRVQKAALRQAYQADVVEMEGAAVAQVCGQQHVPCLIVRGVSDEADEDAGEDLRCYTRVAAENSARVIAAILDALTSP